VENRTKICIDMQSRTWETRPADPKDKWSSADTETSWTFERYRWGGESRWSFMVPESWKDGRVLYFVYVIYSTGDSFHTSDRANCEGIGVYDSLEKAEDVERAIWNDYNGKDVDFSDMKPLVVNGQSIYTYPWKGYFERLDDVQVQQLRGSKSNF